MNSYLRRLPSLTRVAFIALSVLAGTQAQAGFLGHTVDADYRFPDINTVADGMSNQVVGAGTEFSLFGVAIDLTDTDIIFSRPGPSTFEPGSFNGWSFFDVFATIDPIVGVDIISTNVGLDASRISFDADHVFVNFQNLAGSDFETTLHVQFQNSIVVPEPGSLALLGLGLAGLASLRRMKPNRRER